MTGELQAMDLMVNGPLKAAFRRERSLQLFQYFQQRVAQRRALLLPAVPAANHGGTPKLCAAQAEPQRRIAPLLCDSSRVASDPHFVQSLHRVFVTIGQVPDDGIFRKYPDQHGILHRPLLQCMNDDMSPSLWPMALPSAP